LSKENVLFLAIMSEVSNKKGDFLSGKSYTWNSATIRFINGLLATPWSIGTYTYNENSVNATWSGYSHDLTFNPDYTSFTSVRKNDNEVVTGKLSDKKSLIPSVHVDYKSNSTELCEIGKKYNVDKSSQRENPGPNDSNHCHPYSLLYHALFHNNRNDSLNFCEIGIAEGRSLLMWEEYFSKAEIYGFEFLPKWLTHWSTNFSHKTRIHVNYMNVCLDNEIVDPLKNCGESVKFDCIIDDSSHAFYDMIRIIKQAHTFVKPGGMIIIEDIQRSFDEVWFYEELKDVLHEFQTVFFVDLEHARRNSGTVNNDKVLILVKNGTPIFNCSLF